MPEDFLQVFLGEEFEVAEYFSVQESQDSRQQQIASFAALLRISVFHGPDQERKDLFDRDLEAFLPQVPNERQNELHQLDGQKTILGDEAEERVEEKFLVQNDDAETEGIRLQEPVHIPPLWSGLPKIDGLELVVEIAPNLVVVESELQEIDLLEVLG